MKAVIFSLWFIVSCMMISAVSAESSDQIDSQNNLEFEVYRDMAGEWRWRLWSENGRKIASSGEGYRNKADCLRGIEIVQSSNGASITEQGQ